MRRTHLASVAAGLGLLVLVLALGAQTPPQPRLPHFTEHLPSVIAHGGAQAHAPGNTMPAFELAVEQGADVLEMDAQITADGDVVVHHDGTVDRQTDGTGAVGELTVAELKELDAGHDFTAADGSTPYRGQGVQIPTLDEVFDAFPDDFMIVELKTDGGMGIVDAVAERIEAAERTDRTVVASFDTTYLEAFRERIPAVPTNLGESEVRRLYLLHLAGLHRWHRPAGEFLHVPEYSDDTRVVTPRFIGAAEHLGLDVQVWTINERDDMRRLLELGVHGIMTDVPDVLDEVVDEVTAEREAVIGAAGHERGLALIRWLQDRLAVLTPVAAVVTHLGDEEFYLLAFPLLYWSVSRAIGLQMGLALLLSAGLNSALKLGFLSPRPYFVDPSVGMLTETSLGIPSGHAQNAVAVWGTVAADVQRRGAWGAAVGVMLVLGWSRLQLGVHFPEDVLLGWGVGAAFLLLFLQLRRPVGVWLAARGPAHQIGVALAGALGLITVGALLRGTVGWDLPDAWLLATGEGFDEEATGLANVVTPAAALFGLAVGVVALAARGGFDSTGTLGRRLLRYPIGLIGVVVLWQGLGAVLPGGESIAALGARFVRYALVGAWIAGGAPLLFVRLRLARPAGPAPEELADDPSAARPLRP